MGRYFIRRFLQMIVVLFIVSILVFFISSFIGDPVSMMLPEKATQSEIEAARAYLGLDKPLIEQYYIFMKNIAKGEFGKSYRYKRSSIILIMERMPATLEMVVLSSFVSGVMAIILGVFAGAYPKSKISKAIMTMSIFGISLPSFWVGMIMICIFSLKLGLLPPSGRGEVGTFLGISSSLFTKDGWSHLILPSSTLALTNLATMLRLVRAGMRENMNQDYIKFARAKGAPIKSILFGHALKNTLIPVITIFGLQIGNLLAFTTITETIFAWPGMGKLLIDSIYASDKPIIVGYLLVVAVVFVMINFTIDILYTVIDPRIELK